MISISFSGFSLLLLLLAFCCTDICVATTVSKLEAPVLAATRNRHHRNATAECIACTAANNGTYMHAWCPTSRQCSPGDASCGLFCATLCVVNSTVCGAPTPAPMPTPASNTRAQCEACVRQKGDWGECDNACHHGQYGVAACSYAVSF